MPEIHILDYQTGSGGNQNYREIWQGKSLFIYEIPTDKLFERIGTDPINRRTTAELVEDSGLKRLVFERWFSYLAKR